MAVITCISCMRKYEERFGACPYCGYSTCSSKSNVNQLAVGTRLQNKYVVGKMIGSGGFGITYAGYNEVLDQKVAIKEYFPRGFASRNTFDNTTVLITGPENGFNAGRIKFLKEA